MNYVRNVLGKTLLLRNFPRINTPFPYFFSSLPFPMCVFLIAHFQPTLVLADLYQCIGLCVYSNSLRENNRKRAKDQVNM